MAREWLRNLRTDKGFSQAEIARKLGISRQYYYYIERGDRMESLDLDIADRLAKIFKISVATISKHEQSMKEELLKKE